MKNNTYYHYYVEGEDDKKIVDTLKSEMRLIISGKCEVFNIIEKKLNKNHVMNLKNGTIVILVFDIDTNNISVLKENIQFLKEQKIIKRVICIPQVMNLEDELLKSCRIRQISELTNSRSNKDYKSDILRINNANLKRHLEKCDFNLDKFWNSFPENDFSSINNDSNLIKINRHR